MHYKFSISISNCLNVYGGQTNEFFIIINIDTEKIVYLDGRPNDIFP